MPVSQESKPEEQAIQRIATALEAEKPPGAADVQELREFVYRLLSGEFFRPTKPGAGGLRQLFRSFGYEDYEITKWLELYWTEAEQRRSQRLEYYAGWLTGVLARNEPIDLSDFHADRARASVEGRREQVRRKAGKRCETEHWLGYLPKALRTREFRSTGTNFVYRATVGGGLYRGNGTIIARHASLLTRTILFPILETPGGFPLYWRTAENPDYRDIHEDSGDKNPVFDAWPIVRSKKKPGSVQDWDPPDDRDLVSLITGRDSVESILEQENRCLFLICPTCKRIVGPDDDWKGSRCVREKHTWVPKHVPEADLMKYDLAATHVCVKVCRELGHLWTGSGPAKCPASGCGSPALPVHKRVSVDLPVTYSRHLDYETFMKNFSDV